MKQNKHTKENTFMCFVYVRVFFLLYKKRVINLMILNIQHERILIANKIFVYSST